MAKPILQFKVCKACGIEKPRSEYYKKGSSITTLCKICSNAEMKTRQHKYIGKYVERQNAWRRERYQTDPGYRAHIAETKKRAYEVHRETANAIRRERWANDPLCPARKYYRRKDVKDRTPKWVDLNEMIAIYSKCPKGLHVDHIVPLKGLIDGRPVTGLHVPWNLQFLTPEENLKKKNRITEDYLNTFVK